MIDFFARLARSATQFLAIRTNQVGSPSGIYGQETCWMYLAGSGRKIRDSTLPSPRCESGTGSAHSRRTLIDVRSTYEDPAGRKRELTLMKRG